MNDAIRAMLSTYGSIDSIRDEDNALKEIIQQITLLGLYRSGFFEHASFYGGTALRLLYGLDRFSEDLDFCLHQADPTFTWTPYLESIKVELERYGFNANIQEKKSNATTAIESAFVKQNTRLGLLVIERNDQRAARDQLIKVKLEVDKSNPQGYDLDYQLVPLPVPFMLTTLTEPSLLSGKLHALLARSYQNRVKGRDYYDFIFYTSRNTPFNRIYLEGKLRDSGHYTEASPLTQQTVITLLQERFDQVNFDRAKEDVRPFLKPNQHIDIDHWSPALFKAMARRLKEEMT